MNTYLVNWRTTAALVNWRTTAALVNWRTTAAGAATILGAVADVCAQVAAVVPGDGLYRVHMVEGIERPAPEHR